MQPCLVMSRIFPGPLTCTSRAAISIADGSILPCFARWGCKDQAPYRIVATNGWTLDEQGPSDVEIAWQCG